MKIKIDIDVTPDELRAFFGLPEVKPFQDAMLKRLEEQLEAGAEELDPMNLMRPFLVPNAPAMEAMQRAFWNAFTATGKDSGTSD